MPRRDLTDVAEEAIVIYTTWDEVAGHDAGFDGGEFSGPASSRAADADVARLAESAGYTRDDVLAEVNRICNNEPYCYE